MAKDTGNALDDASAAATGSAPKGGHRDAVTLPKQQRLYLSVQSKLVIKTDLNALVGRYVVKNMLWLLTDDSDSFRGLIAKITLKRGGGGHDERRTFSKDIIDEYIKINTKYKINFEELEYVTTTADIWTAHDKSFFGVTAHWIDPPRFKRRKADLACKCFKGSYTNVCSLSSS